MKHLADYSLKQLSTLTEKDLNKFKSNLKRKRVQHLFLGKVGTKEVQYSEKGQLEFFGYEPVMVTVPVNAWFEVPKQTYDAYKNKTINSRSFKDIEEVKTKTVTYQNNLMDDLAIAAKELSDLQTIKNYKNLIAIKEQLLELSFDYSTDLYELTDEYAMDLLEEKAEYFDRYTNSIRHDLVLLRVQLENCKVAKEEREKQAKINKLIAEKEKIDAELQQVLNN